MKKSRLAGVIEAEKQDLGLFLPQSQGGQHAVEPIQEKHPLSSVFCFLIFFSYTKKKRQKKKKIMMMNGGRDLGWVGDGGVALLLGSTKFQNP